MKCADKKFAIDLLKALDIAINGKLREESDYKTDLMGMTRKEVLKAVKYLKQQGYCKQEQIK